MNNYQGKSSYLNGNVYRRKGKRGSNGRHSPRGRGRSRGRGSFRGRRSPKTRSKESSPIGFEQKISKGPGRGHGFKWPKPQSRSKSPLFKQKPRSRTPIESNESVIVPVPKILQKSMVSLDFPHLQNTRQCRSESPTPYPRQRVPYYKYIPRENIVTCYDEEGKQYIGILLNTNIHNYPNNMFWIDIMERQYGCVNIRSNFNYDGFSIFQVLNLQNFNNNCPFHVEWIRTDIYTSKSFDIQRINKGGIVGEYYFVNEERYQTRFDNNKCCNYILKCDQCGIFFRINKRCDKCRWCSA